MQHCRPSCHYGQRECCRGTAPVVGPKLSRKHQKHLRWVRQRGSSLFESYSLQQRNRHLERQNRHPRRRGLKGSPTWSCPTKLRHKPQPALLRSTCPSHSLEQYKLHSRVWPSALSLMFYLPN